MTSRYNKTENTITELPGMEKPEPPKRIDMYYDAMQKYNAHIASLRTIPCDPSCRELWTDKGEYEEGRHFEARYVCNKTGAFYSPDCVEPTCDNCTLIAFPLSPAVQEDEKQFGYWQLCPKCDGEGYIPGTHYNGETLSVDRTCPVCNGDKILARPVIDNNEKQ